MKLLRYIHIKKQAVVFAGILVSCVFFLNNTPHLAQASSTFTLQTFNNMSLSGTPSLTQTVSTIDISTLRPLSSARWDGTISVPTASAYQFFVRSQDGMQIWLDGTRIFSKWIQQNNWSAFYLPLTAGNHSLHIEYYQYDVKGHASVSWNPVVNASITAQNSSQVSFVGSNGTHYTPSDPLYTPPVVSNNPEGPISPTPIQPTNPIIPITPVVPVTPIVPTDTSGRTAVVFVTGYGCAPGCDLQAAITARYKPLLPANTPWLVLAYTQDVAGIIRAQFPGKRIILIGHSFGGNAAINAAAALGTTPVELLMLFDPVHINSPGVASDFIVSSNVKKAIDFRRQFVDQGFPPGGLQSGFIANASAQYQNSLYAEDASRRYDVDYINQVHGWQVWQTDTNIPIIKASL